MIYSIIYIYNEEKYFPLKYLYQRKYMEIVVCTNIYVLILITHILFLYGLSYTYVDTYIICLLHMQTHKFIIFIYFKMFTLDYFSVLTLDENIIQKHVR